jgi:2'-5' RNA ligase
LRLFVSVGVHDCVRKTLSCYVSAASSLFPEFSFAPSENLHITLAFLADVKQVAVPGIIECLQSAAACQKPFNLSLGEPGAFVSKGETRILYIGLNCRGNQLDKLACMVRRSLIPLGFTDGQPFRAHITLARKKRRILSKSIKAAQLWKESCLKIIKDYEGTVESSWCVQNISLMESHLGGPVPVYKEIHSVPLGQFRCRERADNAILS